MTVIVERVAVHLLAPALMVAAALIVKGYTDAGEGFSAGVIVTLAIAARYVALGAERTEAGLPLLRHAPAGAVVGLLVALAAGFFAVLLGDPPFTHVPAPRESPVTIGTVELITAVVFDVGLFVLVLSTLVMLVHHVAVLERRPRA